MDGMVKFSLTLCCILSVYGIVCMIFDIIAKTKRWQHRRKADARIIRQAKALNVWDKPTALGGRALELKAWQDYKIKREPGESDACLRHRCTIADKELANAPKE